MRNIFRESRNLDEELLDAALAESPLASLVGLGYSLSGMELAYSDKLHTLRECGAYIA